eukprot:PRCOL_00004443-RA
MRVAAGIDVPREYPRDFVPLFGSNVQASVEYYADMYDKRGEWDIAEMTGRVDELKIQLYKERSRGGMDAFAGVRELAAVAHEAGVAVGIGSSGTPEKIAHNLSAAGLADVFPDERLIVSATHVARGKPAPDVYVEVLARLAADATAAGRPMDDSKPPIVVEDAVLGLQAAKAAGAIAVAVPNTLPVEALAPHADCVVASVRTINLYKPIRSVQAGAFAHLCVQCSCRSRGHAVASDARRSRISC